MEQERLDELKAKFAEAYEWRADESDIEFKEMGYGKSLAYLSWAVAWRKMKEIYPDCNYRLVENADGNPLWNVNGYGMLKCAVSACGVEHIETFPIMDNKNNAVAIESIDARDINDSMQRGLTKAIARFGVGLYIFEGKLEAPKKAYSKPKDEQPQNNYNSTANRLQEAPKKDPNAPLSDKQRAFVDSLLQKSCLTLDQFQENHGYNPYANVGNAQRAINDLKKLKGEN